MTQNDKPRYDGQPISDPIPNTHPIFTQRCPDCELPLLAATGRVYRCGDCGWVDESGQ